jgi:hypothetical protein
MKFLRKLFLRWANWLETKLRRPSAEREGEPLGVSRELAVDELVARFIYSRNHMSPLHGRPKPEAFQPPSDKPLSVVHSTGLSDHDIWEIGRLHALGNQPGRDKIRGRADVPIKALIEKKLCAIRDDNPFKRHTSVVGWPVSADADERKRQRLAICLELSQDPDIKLVIPESPITRAAHVS